jgi:hypothetical protein
MIKKHQETSDEIISKAFEKHFGFPISEVDLSEVTYSFLPQTTLAEFKYNGEVFLLMDSSTDFKTGYNSEKKAYEVTQEILYKEL